MVIALLHKLALATYDYLKRSRLVSKIGLEPTYSEPQCKGQCPLFRGPTVYRLLIRFLDR